jgi:regulator of sigma E protease
VPTYDEDLGVFTLGIQPGVDRRGRIEVAPGSAAEKAGLRSGDQLVGVEGRPGGSGAGAAARVRLLRPARRSTRASSATDAHSRPRSRRRSRPRARPRARCSASCRSPAAWPPCARARARNATGLAQDDRLLGVAGRRIARPYDLLRALSEAGDSARFEFERQGERRSTEVTGLDTAAKLELWSSIAVAADMGDTRVAVLPGSAAERAGLRDGDRVLKLDGAELRQYSELQAGIQRKPKGEAAAMVVERVGEAGAKELPRDLGRPGRLAAARLRLRRAAGRVHLPGVGLPARAARGLALVVEVPRGRLADAQAHPEPAVSGKKAVGGIITIGVVSHRFAESGLASLLFFLCTLSMNLAFLNVLPIPVLDGGHLFFLLVEKIKGSPVSEKVLGYSQMVGIVLILSLMVYVTFNDVMRWIVKS